jgi:hypothetical protein
MSGYIKEKCSSLLQKGMVLYREQDFFKHPPSDLTEEEQEGLLNASRQVCEGRGFSSESPIENVAVNHIIIFAHCYHFRVGRWKGTLENGVWLDELPLTHVVNGSKTTLYLHSRQDLDRLRGNRRLPIFQSIGPEYLPPLQYAPRLTMSEVIQTGVIGEYRYSLHASCQAEGSIEYRYVLFCYALDLESPCLAVTAEVSTYDSSLLLLCVFEGGNHKNYGSRHQISTIDEFHVAALDVARKIIGIE